MRILHRSCRNGTKCRFAILSHTQSIGRETLPFLMRNISNDMALLVTIMVDVSFSFFSEFKEGEAQLS